MLKHARLAALPSHAPESSSSLSVGRAEPPLVSPALPSLPPTPPPKDYFRPLALDDRDAPGPSSEPISHVSGVKRTSIDTPKASDVFSHHTLTPKVSRPNLKRADAFAPTSSPSAPESSEIARNTTPVETHSHIGLVARPSSSNSTKKAALRAASTNHPTHHLSPPTKRRPRRASLPSSFLSSRSREPPPPLPTTTTNSNNNTSTNPIIRLKHPTLEPPLSLDILGPPPNSESHHPPRPLHSRPIQPPFIAIDVHAPPLAPPPSEPPLSNAVIDDGAIVSSPVDSISVSHASAFTHGGIPSTNGHASMSVVVGGGGGGRARGRTLSRAVQRTMHALLELIESEQSYVADLKLLARYAQSFTADRALSLALLASNSAQGSNQQQKEQPIMNRLNISQLLDTHNPLARALQDLHPSVQGAIQSGTGESSSPNERDVVELLACAAGVFRDFDEHGTAYDTYCSAHGDVLDVLRPIQNSTEYAAFEQQAAASGTAAANSPMAPSEKTSVPSSSAADPVISGASTSQQTAPPLKKTQSRKRVSITLPRDSEPANTSTTEFGGLLPTAAATINVNGVDESTTATASGSGGGGGWTSNFSLTPRSSFKSLRRSLRKSPSRTSSTKQTPSPSASATDLPSYLPVALAMTSSKSSPTPSTTAISDVSSLSPSAPATPSLSSSQLYPNATTTNTNDSSIPPVPPIPPSMMIPTTVLTSSTPRTSLSAPNTPSPINTTNIHSVSPVNTSSNASSSFHVPPPPSKPLAFRDLLIKPIQRVCRYPLLLAQLRLPESMPASLVSAAVNESGQEGEEKQRVELSVRVRDAGEGLEDAIAATRRVALAVDAAQEQREVLAKSALVAERLDGHPILSQTFLKSLGPCTLASSLEASYATVVDPFSTSGGSSVSSSGKVKFVAVFLYKEYILLVKVRKNGRYILWHWFGARGCVVLGCDDDFAPPNSFKLRHRTHEFELTASCQDERLMWMKALMIASQDQPRKTEPPSTSPSSASSSKPSSPIEMPKSSLDILEESSNTTSGVIGSLTPKKRQSFFGGGSSSNTSVAVTPVPSSASIVAPTTSTSVSRTSSGYIPPVPITGASVSAGVDSPVKAHSTNASTSSSAPVPTITRHPSTIKRLSTASLASLFGPSASSEGAGPSSSSHQPSTSTTSPSSGPSSIPIPRRTAQARSTPAMRLVVDRGIRDVMSDAILSTRAQAQINGELFAVPAPAAASSSASSRKRTTSALTTNSSDHASDRDRDLTPRKRRVVKSVYAAYGFVSGNNGASANAGVGTSIGASASVEGSVLGRMSEESQGQLMIGAAPSNGAASEAMRRSLSSPSQHRRTRSLPGHDPMLGTQQHPDLLSSSPVGVVSMSSSVLVNTPRRSATMGGGATPSPTTKSAMAKRKRTVFDLADEAIAQHENPQGYDRDDSDLDGEGEDEYAESGWERDDTNSAAHTDFSSVETHPRVPAKANLGAIPAKPLDRDPSPSAAPTIYTDGVRVSLDMQTNDHFSVSLDDFGARAAADEDEDENEDEFPYTYSYIGKGITNTPPAARERSLFRKSLMALSRRRRRSSQSPHSQQTPSPSPPRSTANSRTPSPSNSRSHNHQNHRQYRQTPSPNNTSTNSQFLSPTWISAGRRATPPNAINNGSDSVGSKSLTPTVSRTSVGATSGAGTSRRGS